MTDRPRALVIGGSVGGLFAARLLMRAGWEVSVFERSEGDLAGRGAGVGITRELLDALAAAGAPADPTIGLAVESFVWLDRTGETVFEHPRAMGASAWVRVYQTLRIGFPDAAYRSGLVATHIEQDNESVTAIFEDGHRETGDLLVAADGNLSALRAQFLPGVEPAFAGYVAWRGMVDAGDLPAAARAAIDRHIVYSFHIGEAGGEMMLTMPVPGLHPGEASGRYYFIWYRPIADDAAMLDLFTDADGHHHSRSIPPPLIRQDVLAALRRDAEALFSPAAAAAVRCAPQPLLQAISDLAAPKLDHGRVALLGDAACVARPHVAGGITKAAMNARALADALDSASDVPTALARYDASQRDLGRRLLDHARYLGSYVEQAPGAPDEKTVMRDYGAPHILRDPAPEDFIRG